MSIVRPACFLVLVAGALAAPRAAHAQDVPDADAPSVAPAGEPASAPPAAAPAAPPPPPPAYLPPPGTAPGYAAPSYPPPGYLAPGAAPPEPAHSGLYVHLQAGGGYTSISGADSSGNSVKIAGSGPSLAVAVGGAVAPNLALFGNLFLTMASQPHITEGVYQTDATGDATVGGFGGGVVYYFMPVNVYLSAALGAVDLEEDDGNGTTRTISNLGLGFQGLVGKEWAVSSHWGLGAALELVTASMKDKNDSGITWKADAFNLLFSATYF